MGECPACAQTVVRVPQCPERDAALAAYHGGVEQALNDSRSKGRIEGAEALEARYVAGIRHALRTLHAVHSTLPDGETVPRQSADALALAVEGALVAVLGGGVE
jgi:hypothetical protein